MREILFRGKQIDYGEWVYGLLCYNTYNQLCIQPIEYFPCCVVIPESISEFTGLTDKNGKKIFEGDIVAGAVYWQESPKNGVVTFRDGSFGWYGIVAKLNSLIHLQVCAMLNMKSSATYTIILNC